MDRLQVDLEVGQLEKNLARITTFKNALKTADAEIARLSAGTSFAGKFDAQLAKATARHKQFVADIKRQSAGTGGGSGDFASSVAGGIGLGGSLGTIVGGAIGTGLAVGARQAFQAAKEAEDANRVLRASAVETGIAYDQLATKADEFGKRAALSNTDAQKTFAQLVNFANAAGRTDKLDEFQKRFTDLAAAKGINASQLGDISRQLNALTDEATDKLLNANPSAFYDKFARSIGKTAETLTDAEKRAAVFDEVLKKGSIFTGEAERRAAGFSGEVDQLRKTFDDLTASAGKALVPVAQFVLNGGQINRRFFQSDAERVEIQRNAKIIEDLRTKEIVEALQRSDAKIAAARANPTASKENFILSGIDISKSYFSQKDREKAVQTATENANLFIADLTKRLERGLSGGPDLAKFANQEFRRNINLFDADTRDKFIENFSSAQAEGFRRILSDAKKTVPELRKALAEVSKSPDLTSRDRTSVLADFEREIKQRVDAGKEKVKEFKKTTDQFFAELFAKQGQANPFVSVYSEAETAIERTRKATAALSVDLQTQARQMVETLNQNALFSARLSNFTNAVDLVSDAENFRRGRNTTQADLTANKVIARYTREIASGLFRNPENLAVFRSGTSATTAVELFDFQRRLEQSGGLFRNPLADAETRRRLAESDPNQLTTAERLDRQLSVVNRLRPENDFQRAEADRKIIALTQGLNPADLTDSQRNAAAGAREREAERLLNAEADARAARDAQLKVQTSIDKNIADLLKLAQSDGLTGVIRIINDAENNATTKTQKRPSESDTRAQMEN